MSICKLLFVGLLLMLTAKQGLSQGTINFASQANPVLFPDGGSDQCFVQLYWAPVGTESFTPVAGSPARFRSDRYGFWDARTQRTVTTPGLEEGSQIQVMALVWGGTAIDDVGNGLFSGQSAAIVITTGSPTSPASIAGIPSFPVYLAIPEPSTLVLGLLGAGILFLKRR